MPLNPLYLDVELPPTSEAALREFNDRYLACVGVSAPTGWADKLGDLIPTDRVRITFPVNQMTNQYTKTTGENRFKTFRETSFDVKTVEYDIGAEAPLLQLMLEVFAYRKWQEEPAKFVEAEAQFRHVQIAAILDGTGTRSTAATQGGVGTNCVDGTPFFGTTHPVNLTDSTVAFNAQYSSTPVKTWSNYQSSAKNILGSQASGNSGVVLFDNFVNEVVNMQVGVPDENGILLGADPDTVLVPQDYYEPFKNAMMNQRLAQLVTNTTSNDVAMAALENVLKGRYEVMPVKEFTLANGSTADWYLVDSKLIKRGVAPWAIVKQSVAQSLALRMYDESTDFFRDTGHIKVSSHIYYGFGLVFPHAIRRIVGPTRTSTIIGS